MTANAFTLNGTASGMNSVPDNYDLGAILPSGLTQGFLASDLTLQWNVFGGGLALKQFFFPEPSAMGVIGVATAVLLARRRRRRTFAESPHPGPPSEYGSAALTAGRGRG